MNKHLLLILLGLGLIGCGVNDDKSRLICECEYLVDYGKKSDCELSAYDPFESNISLVIDDKDKTFTFNGFTHSNYDDSIQVCLDDVNGTLTYSECEKTTLYDYGKMVEFSADRIQYFNIDSVFGSVFTEFDRTNLVLREQIRVASKKEQDDGLIREPTAISASFPYRYYQCVRTDGV